MSAPETPAYALHDDAEDRPGAPARWWIYVGRGVGVPHVGEFPLTPASAQKDWWLVPCVVTWDPATTVVELVRPGRRVVDHYTLVRRVEGLPDRLTPAEYEDGVEEFDDESLYRLVYAPVYAETGEVRERVGPFLVLEGAPPPTSGPRWYASLPSVLGYQPQYLHLFPGNLRGLRQEVIERLGAIDGVSAYDKPGAVEVYVKVDVPRPPRLQWEAGPHLAGLSRADRKRALAARETATQTVTRHLEVSVPGDVAGPNQAAAQARWDEIVDEIVGYVEGILAHPCPTCHGHGWLER